MGGSTSHKRKTRRKSARPFTPRPQPASSTVTLEYADLSLQTGIGYNLLKKSGWIPGSPLGASSPASSSSLAPLSPAVSSPIPIVVKRGRAGIGAHHEQLPSSALIRSGTSLPARSAPSLSSHTAVDASLCRALANMDVFDPLRPKCRFDDSHVVRNLKALHKHELSCPANPTRMMSRRASVPTLAVDVPSSSANPFGQLDVDAELDFSSEEETDSCDDDMSSISVCSDERNQVDGEMEHPSLGGIV